MPPPQPPSPAQQPLPALPSTSTPSASSSRPLLTRLHDTLSRPSTASDQSTILHELLSTLTEDARALDRGTEEVESTLFFDPFPILLLLAPLLRINDPRTTAVVRGALELLAGHSSAKEVVMGIGERLAGLGPAEESDSEEEGGGATEGVEEAWDGVGAARELGGLIGLYAKVLPRIKAKRPANFLKTAVETILAAVAGLTEAGAFVREDDGGEEGSALEIFGPVLSFIATLESDLWISAVRELCIPHLRTLLVSTTTLLHPSLPSDICNTFFLAAYPRYRIPSRALPPTPRTDALWTSALIISRSVGLTPQSLLESSTSPTLSIGSFILLTHHLSSTPFIRPYSLASSSTLLSRMTPLLMLAFASGTKEVGEDEALFWAWWCVEGAVREGEEIDERVVFTLVEILSSVAALSPNPATRFLAFRLIATLVMRGTSREGIQLMLLKDLVEDCPFEQMRVAGTGLLREVLAEKLGSEESLFASPLLLAELGRTFLRFDPVDLLAEGEMELDEFLDKYQRSTVEKLGLYYFLLVRDVANKTGIRSTASVSAANEHFVNPLRRHATAWSAVLEIELAQDGAAAELFQQRMELELVVGSLRRVEEALAAS